MKTFYPDCPYVETIFSEDASGNKAAFLNSVPNWRERKNSESGGVWATSHGFGNGSKV